MCIRDRDPDGVNDASADGRNFAVSGGVAQAVVNVIRERFPERDIQVASAEGLQECRKLMTGAVAGKYPGYLLEGMACPVSYTHLDVYKRQPPAPAWCPRTNSASPAEHRKQAR